MKMNRVFFGVLSIILFVGNSFASELDGTWQGTISCRDGEYSLEMALQTSGENQVTGEVRYTLNNDTASYLISGNFKPTKNQWVFKRGKVDQ